MTIDTKTRKEPEKVLQAMEVHDQWIGHFRSAENEPFYNLAFNYISGRFGSSEGAVLDAGCGSATKTLHLARRGFRVLALDISESILATARVAVEQAGYGSQVEFRSADLTQIDLPTASISRGVCWGVLMHIPAVEKAVAELSRVLAPGGILVISEGNQNSFQAVLLRALKRFLGKERAEVLRTPAGIEHWEETSTGRFMTRQANIQWLIREFERHGLELQTRRAGQLTEIFTIVPWRPVRLAVHFVNNLWFRILPWWAAPAFGNLLVFRRPLSRQS